MNVDWNPLIHDADAFDLIASVAGYAGIDLKNNQAFAGMECSGSIVEPILSGDDRKAALRRAIVRAVIEFGS